MNEKFSKLGFYPADILLPNKDVDMEKWAVVACDQFTSEPEYWERVEKTVGDAPSTLRLILPEANLKAPNVDEFIADINASMDKYLKENIFETLKDSLIYIERGQSDGKIRHGLIGMVDLDQYDFTPGSGALIRATEGTVLDRIPPRARVRRNAPIELPHVMLLIDDPKGSVIEPLTAESARMEKLYDFDLQQGGGHLTGWQLTADQIDGSVTVSFTCCAPADDPQIMMLLTLSSASNDTGTYRSGGNMAAPVASSIMAEILPYLGIEPTYSADELVGADHTVPNVVGLKRDEAATKLKEEGFSCRTVGDGETVTDQTPLGGAIVPNNAEIILYLGAEKSTELCIVPNVVGDSAAAANRKLTDAGLIMSVSGATGGSSASVRAISQSEMPGTEVAAGTVVRVQFSDSSVTD